MQSESVLDLLLNFSAMEFVSLVDDVTFAISTEGFFGLMMKEEATTLTVMQYSVGSETAATFWIYTCGKIFVQFDELDPYLGIVAGLYQRNRYITYGGKQCLWRVLGAWHVPGQ